MSDTVVSHNSEHVYVIQPGCTCGWKQEQTVTSRSAAEKAWRDHFVDCIVRTRTR